MAHAVIEYRDENTGTVFRWHGGEYVDVGHYGEAGSVGIDGDNFHAYDVLNVWEYVTGRSHFEAEAELAGSPRPFRHVLELFEARCEQYLHTEAEVEA